MLKQRTANNQEDYIAQKITSVGCLFACRNLTCLSILSLVAMQYLHLRYADALFISSKLLARKVVC